MKESQKVYTPSRDKKILCCECILKEKYFVWSQHSGVQLQLDIYPVGQNASKMTNHKWGSKRINKHHKYKRFDHFWSSLAGNSDVECAHYATILVCDLMTHNLKEMRLKFSTFAFSGVTYHSLREQQFHFVVK